MSTRGPHVRCCTRRGTGPHSGIPSTTRAKTASIVLIVFRELGVFSSAIAYPADCRIPFNPNGGLAAILKRRSELDPDASVFGSANGTYQPNIRTSWDTLRLLANGIEPKPGKEGAGWSQEQLRHIDLRWQNLRHEGAGRLLADGVDIRIIQSMLGHASIQQTQRYLNVTDEEMRNGPAVSWNNKGRPLRLASGSRSTSFL